jgi:hypothetical protein
METAMDGVKRIGTFELYVRNRSPAHIYSDWLAGIHTFFITNVFNEYIKQFVFEDKKEGTELIISYTDLENQILCPCCRCVLLLLTPTLYLYIESQNRMGRDDEVLIEDIERRLQFYEFAENEKLDINYNHLRIKCQFELPFMISNSEHYAEINKDF